MSAQGGRLSRRKLCAAGIAARIGEAKPHRTMPGQGAAPWQGACANNEGGVRGRQPTAGMSAPRAVPMDVPERAGVFSIHARHEADAMEPAATVRIPAHPLSEKWAGAGLGSPYVHSRGGADDSTAQHSTAQHRRAQYNTAQHNTGPGGSCNDFRMVPSLHHREPPYAGRHVMAANYLCKPGAQERQSARPTVQPTAQRELSIANATRKGDGASMARTQFQLRHSTPEHVKRMRALDRHGVVLGSACRLGTDSS